MSRICGGNRHLFNISPTWRRTFSLPHYLKHCKCSNSCITWSWSSSLALENTPTITHQQHPHHQPPPPLPHPSNPQPAPLKVMPLQETPTHSCRSFHSEYSQHMGTKSAREGVCMCACVLGDGVLLLLPLSEWVVNQSEGSECRNQEEGTRCLPSVAGSSFMEQRPELGGGGGGG